jgi:hypothetical protein
MVFNSPHIECDFKKINGDKKKAGITVNFPYMGF